MIDGPPTESLAPCSVSLFIDAALVRDADRAAGLDDSLHALTDAPGGQWLLATTGLGLIAAGAYDVATFRRHRIDEA